MAHVIRIPACLLQGSRTAVAVVSLIVAAGLAAPASAQSYNSDGLSPGAVTQVNGACRDIIGTQRGEEHFSACANSLSQSLRDDFAAQSSSRARADCLRQGLAPGSSGLAECVLDAPVTRDQVVAGGVTHTGSPASYFSGSPRELRRREQRACASLGLDPTGQGFDSCVADLSASLFAVDHPFN